jgi:hypothetical protein
MRSPIVALAASLIMALIGPALAQTSSPPGSVESNMNNPGSVKSNEEKRGEALTGVPGTTAPATTGTSTVPSVQVVPNGTARTNQGAGAVPSR